MVWIAACEAATFAVGLVDLGAIIVIDDLDQQIAGFDLLEIPHSDLADIAGNLGGERRQVGMQIGVVGALHRGRSNPPVPLNGDEGDERSDQKQDEQPEDDAEP